jgi:DNA-nicking Smr family endonuclease
MKKKKDKKDPGNFKNNPFKPLKGFTAKAAPVKQSGPISPAGRPTEEDESALFLRAADGARRIGQGPVREGTVVNPAGRGHAADDRDEERLFLQAMQTIGTTAPREQSEPETEESKPRSSMSRMRQLKRGAISISAELDLHGFFKDEALARLERFVQSAFNREFKAVLVITGKGTNSPEGPVLQGAVAAWLRANGKGRVAEFASAPREYGGSGAYVVFLKNR